MSDTEIREDRRLSEPDDAERFAHYFWHPEPGRVQALIMEARVEGFPIEALCGRRLIPQRDPARFPVCPDCERVKREAQGG